MLRSFKFFAFLAVCILLLTTVSLAQDDGLKLTGWPYQVDVVTENLGRFTEQSGHDAVFLPFPSNEYRDKMVASCIVLDYNGTVSNEQKDELWHRFYTLAPQRQRQPAEKYNIVKRA